jgi:ribosomal protein L23
MIDGLNKYCFFVPMNVNKIDIAKGFEQLYGKIPTCSVNTIVLPSKSGSRRVKRKSFKKAIITLAKDDKIDVI